MSPAPPRPPPDAAPRHGGWWRWCLTAGRWCRRAALAAGFCVAAILVWVDRIGFPRFCLDALFRLAAKEGLHLESHSLHFRVTRGLVADGVRLYHADDLLTPAVRARSVRLDIDLWQGFRKGFWIEGLELEQAQVRDPAQPSEQAALRVDNLGLSLRFRPGGGEQVERLGFDLHGLHVTGSGDHVPRPPRSGRRGDKSSAAPTLAEIHREIRRIEPVLRVLSGIRFSSPPKIHFAFHLDDANPSLSRLEVSCDYHEGAVFEGRSFRSLSFRVLLDPRGLLLEPFRLDVGDGFVSARLAFDARFHVQDASADFDLPHEYFPVLLPPDLRQELAGLEVDILGRASGRIDLHRQGPPDAGTVFRSQLRLRAGAWRGVPIRDFRGVLQLSPREWSASVEDARIGAGEQAGSLSGNFQQRVSDQSYEADLQIAFAPRAALPVFRDNEHLQEVIGRLESRGAPPRIALRISGRNGAPEAFNLFGRIDGSNLLYRGVPFDQAQLDLTLSNRTVRVDNLRAVQDGAVLDGWLEYHRAPAELRLDLRSAIPPARLAPVISDEIARHAAWLHVAPPCAIRVSGRVDLEKGETHDLSASFSAAELGQGKLRLGSAQGFLTLSGHLLTIPHLEGALHGGLFRGMFQLSSILPRAKPAFFADLVVENASLSELLAALEVEVGQRELGVLSGRASVEGGLHREDRLGALKGEGRAEVRRGRLFSVPFFGGLSKVLSSIIPGFGFAEQTDLTGEFALADRAVQLKEARLLGNLISAQGRGTIGFDGKLSIVVQVKLLKEGILAKALQIISWPITKLFEFKLMGTLKEPDWRPENLPKELFLKFD